MTNRNKGLIVLIITLFSVFLIFGIVIARTKLLDLKPIDNTLPGTLSFQGERVVQIGKDEDFIINQHLKVIDGMGSEVPLVIEGNFYSDLPGIYFLKIRTDLKEGANISTNFTLIVFSEEEFIY